MMASTRLTLFFGLAAASAVLTSGAEHASCTNGRLFISDQVQSKVHVFDLDNVVNGAYEELTSLTVHKPDLGLQAAESSLSTIMVRDRTDGTTIGKVSFITPGISSHDHDGETHVDKDAPSVVAFSIDGWQPTHLTSSEGFLSVFMDGVQTDFTAPAEHNSSAIFVKESEVVATSGTPNVITIPIDGAHHGVSYGLDDDRFLLTITDETMGDIMPDNFIITDASGVVQTEMGNHQSPLCPDYHGSAHVGHTWVHGCAEVGLVKMTYSHTTKAPTWEVLPFPDVTGDGSLFRASTVYGHETGSLFVSDFSMVDLYWNPPPPFYVIPMAAAATSLAEENFVMTNRSATMKTDCGFMLDRAVEDSSVNLVVLHNDGNLQVVPLSSAGVPGMSVDVKINDTINCAHVQMVTGYGVVYIVARGDQPKLYTVDLGEVEEGHLDHAVTEMDLSFAPGVGLVGAVALALPPNLACDVMHGHGGTTTTDMPMADSSIVATLGWLQIAALLWAGSRVF